MKNGINTAGLTKLQSGIDQIINVVFGIFTGITVVIVIALLIWAMVKNQQEEDPMKRKQNTHKILWGARFSFNCFSNGINSIYKKYSRKPTRCCNNWKRNSFSKTFEYIYSTNLLQLKGID
ncbi:hypothetical protein L8F19_03020 [Mycoplasmopsis bovis]|nr:hypothetical protein L8F19_03020 [Mycoplasmopsis bovis]